jgi:nucleoside-diphosphate-sugar epimerase
MTYCLVTGGAGFIGSHLVDELLSQKYRVRVLDNFSTGKPENISHIRDRIELIEGDVRDMETVKRSVEGIRFVFHQAALPSVPRSVKDPVQTNEINVGGTLNMLLAARDAGVERFVFASSSSVYGDSKVSPKSEMLPMVPLSPYALSKVTGEEYCRLFHELYNVKTVVLRYFNVFGPRQDPGSLYAAVIPKFINSYARGKAPEIYGDGNQSRDFTYVLNVVMANILTLTSDEAVGKKLNIACGKETTINELAAMLKDRMKATVDPVHTDARQGDVLKSVSDIERARRLLGYRIFIELDEGLKKTVDWFHPDCSPRE